MDVLGPYRTLILPSASSRTFEPIAQLKSGDKVEQTACCSLEDTATSTE